MFAQWFDARGTAIGRRILMVPGVRKVLASPTGVHGYVGLRFGSTEQHVAFPPQPAGFGSDEYGFAWLSPSRRLGHGRLGVVHADVLLDGREWDPCLRGLHIKTLTWNTVSPTAWSAHLFSRSRAGLLELPVIADKGWKSDGTRPIEDDELEALGAKFRGLVRSGPEEQYWELGVEENLGGRFTKEPCYLANLASKVRRMRAEVPPEKRVRFVYNLEGFEYADHRRFLASAAAREFQVLASHPYPWPDFKSPETWLGAHVQRLRALLAAAGRRDMPIWFTEIGLPVRGNRDPAGFFGYVDSGNRVPGATRDAAARYLVKCCALAIAHGVERTYVYNYQNRGADPRSAEDHFGLRSYAAQPNTPGFPLPAYVAFLTFAQQVAGRRFERLYHPAPGVWSVEFRGRLLVWVFPEAKTRVAWDTLYPGLSRSKVREAFDLYHAPRALGTDGLVVDGAPVYVILR
ncbi:MAG: hypothetical protein H6837_15470 [Planctomycetes bacterium]|nr:hypothetical protein [Planctomycetota bacterium]